MASSIYGMTNYYNLLSSPIPTYKTSSSTNLMYGAMVNQRYGSTIAKNLQSTLSSYLTSLNTNVNALKSSSKVFTTINKNLSFDKKSLSSSDSNAITGSAASNADLGVHTINITKLATSQVNTSAKLDGHQLSFNQGINAFSLKVGNSSSMNLSFSISSTDTNKSVLGKMASSINSAKTGVTANVLSDTATGKSYLSIASDKTGTNNTFSLSDTTGTAISTSGIGTTTVQAQDAQYTLDGKQYTSQDNNIKIDSDKAQLTLKKSDGKDLQITIGSDNSSIKQDIKKLADNYNTLIKFANNNTSNFSGAQSLKNEFSGVVNSRRSSLDSIGITLNSDKTISIDDKKLDKALSEKSYFVKDIVSGNYGLAQGLSSKGSDVLSSLAKYSKPIDFNTNYINPSSYLSSTINLSYGQNMYSGSLLDSLV